MTATPPAFAVARGPEIPRTTALRHALRARDAVGILSALQQDPRRRAPRLRGADCLLPSLHPPRGRLSSSRRPRDLGATALAGPQHSGTGPRASSVSASLE